MLQKFAPNRTDTPVEWGDGPAGVVSLRISEYDRQLARSPDFSYAAHETGHMLGLEDEYEGAVHNEGGPEATADLQRRAGVTAPRRDAATSSVLSEGKDVLPAHYVTFLGGAHADDGGLPLAGRVEDRAVRAPGGTLAR